MTLTGPQIDSIIEKDLKLLEDTFNNSQLWNMRDKIIMYAVETDYGLSHTTMELLRKQKIKVFSINMKNPVHGFSTISILFSRKV